MGDYSKEELATIDERLDPILERAQDQMVEAQQLAFDTTRLHSCTQERLADYKNQGFFNDAILDLVEKRVRSNGRINKICQICNE